MRLARVLVPIGVAALLFSGMIAVGGPAFAATITVNTTDDELNSDGDCSLREAITAANTNAGVDGCPAGQAGPTIDVITFGVTGTITLTGGILTITDDLAINGPGAANLTISGGGTVRVLSLEVASKTLSLSDITVADGFDSYGGGGIWSYGTLTIADSTISGSSAGSYGGGINNLGGTLTVTNSTFSGNSATIGGGINSAGGAITITNSTFSSNSASDSGAGIFSYSGATLNVMNSTFSGNSAGSNGGGIGNQSTATVTKSTFSGNSAFRGGGIAEGTLTVTNSTFSGNSASFQGGGIYSDASLTLTNSTFSGNSVGTGEGGGIFNNSTSTATLANSTFSGNSGGYGGSGGGVSNSFGTLTLRNTIVANSPVGGNCNSSWPVTDGGGNVSWPDTTCPGLNADPLLDSAGRQNNGGPTETIALQTGSPAIDSVSANCPSTDQRGVPRPQGSACDGGAFELAQGIAQVTVDDPATLLATGRVKMTGSLFCGPGGDTFKLYLRADQSATGAVSNTAYATGTCSAGVNGWSVKPMKKSSSPSFAPGGVRVCFLARSFAGSTKTDQLTGCKTVGLVAA